MSLLNALKNEKVSCITNTLCLSLLFTVSSCKLWVFYPWYFLLSLSLSHHIIDLYFLIPYLKPISKWSILQIATLYPLSTMHVAIPVSSPNIFLFSSPNVLEEQFTCYPHFSTITIWFLLLAHHWDYLLDLKCFKQFIPIIERKNWVHVSICDYLFINYVDLLIYKYIYYKI